MESTKHHEGFSSAVCKCLSQTHTIGYGRAMDPNVEGTKITGVEAKMLLENDRLRFEELTRDVLGDA